MKRNTGRKGLGIELVCPPGGRPESEDAEHGQVPTDGDGHGSTCSQTQPEQLEFTLPLVAMETLLRPWKEPRWLPVRPVRCVQPSRQYARWPLHW